MIVHADWGLNPAKQWLACAVLQEDGIYMAYPPERVGNPRALLSRLMATEKRGILVGFDFPIGLPSQYALRAGVEDFLTLLPKLGQEPWEDFFQVAEQPGQIHIRRPFYPQRPGSARLAHLLAGLGMESVHDLRRRCEAGRPGRRPASPLFWTMGAQQVGKAATSGWKEILGPGLEQAQAIPLAIWPFSGWLAELLEEKRLVVVESYPAEFYTHLSISFSPRQAGSRSGKRVQADRAANAPALLAWAVPAPVSLTPDLQQSLLDGFGSKPDGEDRFDAVIGLLGMLNGILGYQPIEEPEDLNIRKVEGWIFGQKISC
jgi:hypothetical protein